MLWHYFHAYGMFPKPLLCLAIWIRFSCLHHFNCNCLLLLSSGVYLLLRRSKPIAPGSGCHCAFEVCEERNEISECENVFVWAWLTFQSTVSVLRVYIKVTLSESFNSVFFLFFHTIGCISKVMASAFSHQKILCNFANEVITMQLQWSLLYVFCRGFTWTEN